MERVYDVAQCIFEEYKKISGHPIDEMKLQKLLYFSQRESLALFGVPMFDADFEGWRYGPVCRDIWGAYTEDGIKLACVDISHDNAYVVRNVINEYGIIESWQLSKLSHKEISWKNSRYGMSDDENGSVPLKLSDIKKDAEKVRPYDHLWDMYYDEFSFYDEPDEAECLC